MIAEPATVLAVGCVELLPGGVHCPRLSWGQFRVVAGAYSVLAVGNVAQVFRSGRIPRLGWVSFERSQELHPIVAIGHIALMIGNGQRCGFGLGQFGVITGTRSRFCSWQRCVRERQGSRPPVPLGSTSSDRSFHGRPCSLPGSVPDPMTE